LKRKQRPAPERAPSEKRLYDRAIAIALSLLALLIPLKFGLPNLDVGAPVIPEDITQIGQNTADFFEALFSFKLRSAVSIVANALSSPWPEEIAQILILLIVFLWEIKSISERRFVLRVGKVDLMMWLFVLVGLIATLLSPAVHSSVVVLKQFVSYALLYFVIVHAADTPAQQKRLIRCFLISTSIVAIIGLHQFAIGLEEQAEAVRKHIAPELQDAYLARLARGRVFSAFVYPNSFAGFLLVAFPLTVFFAFLHREWFKRGNLHKGIAYLIVVPLPCLTSFVLTQSKAGYLTLLLVALAAVVAGRKKLGLNSRILVAGTIVVLLVVAAVLMSPVGRRLVVEKGRYTFAERLNWWEASCRMIPRSPLIGSGFNSFGLLYSRYRLPGTNEARSVHNNYLQVLVETGVLGFLFFAGVWVCSFAAALPLVRKYLKGDGAFGFRPAVVLSSFVGILCFLIHGTADFDLYVPGVAMSVYLLLGLMVRNASADGERSVQLTERSVRLGLIGLVAICGFGVFFSAKTLNANAHFALAQSILQMRDRPPSLNEYEEAIYEVQSALKWDRRDPNLHAYLAGVYFHLGRFDDALREYTIADRLLHRLVPRLAHDVALTKLTRMEAEGKVDWQEVLRHFQDAASRSPAHPFYRLVYAYYLAQAGEQQKSLEELRKARELDPSGELAMETARLIYRGGPLIAALERFFKEGGSDRSHPEGPKPVE
jgi:putative inorganic carbon (HCO3(-)) transporter